MNVVLISGRLTDDPKCEYTPNGLALCRFFVAVNRDRKNKDGKREADFPRVIVFGKQAENLEAYVGKGCRVEVRGRMQTGRYENKRGEMVYTTDIIADDIEYIDFKDREGYRNTNEDRYNEPDNEYRNLKPTKPSEEDGFAMLDEDIPF